MERREEKKHILTNAKMVPVPLDSRSQSHIEQALHHCQIRKTVWFENADKTIFRFCFSLSLSFDKLFHVQCDVRPTLTSLDLFAMLCTHLQMHIFLFSSYNHIKFVLFIYSFFFGYLGRIKIQKWEMVKCHGKNWKHGNHVSCHCHTSAAPCTGQTSGSSCFRSTDIRDGCMYLYIHRKSWVNEILTKQKQQQKSSEHNQLRLGYYTCRKQ